MNMTPAEVVIHEFGIRPLARDLQVNPTTIVRWRGRDGLVPTKYHVPLLELAAANKKPLTPAELVYGRKTRG